MYTVRKALEGIGLEHRSVGMVAGIGLGLDQAKKCEFIIDFKRQHD